MEEREGGMEQWVGGGILRRCHAKQRRDMPGCAGEEFGALGKGPRYDRSLEQPADEAISEVLLEFRAARVQGRHAELATPPRSLQKHARLADACLPFEQQHRSISCYPVAQMPIDPAESIVSL